MEIRRKSLLAAVLIAALILPATIGSVYAGHFDPNKRLKVQVQAVEKVDEWYKVQLMAMGPNVNSLTGEGKYMFKEKDGDMNERTIQIIKSVPNPVDPHQITLWAKDNTDKVVINITINGDTVRVVTPIGSHTFTGEAIKVLDVKNLGS